MVPPGVHLESVLKRTHAEDPLVKPLFDISIPPDAIDIATLEAFQSQDRLVRTWTFFGDSIVAVPTPATTETAAATANSEVKRQPIMQNETLRVRPPKLDVWKLESLYNTLIHSSAPFGVEFTESALDEVTRLMRLYADPKAEHILRRRKVEQRKMVAAKDEELSLQAVRSLTENDEKTELDDEDANPDLFRTLEIDDTSYIDMADRNLRTFTPEMMMLHGLLEMRRYRIGPGEEASSLRSIPLPGQRHSRRLMHRQEHTEYEQAIEESKESHRRQLEKEQSELKTALRASAYERLALRAKSNPLSSTQK